MDQFPVDGFPSFDNFEELLHFDEVLPEDNPLPDFGSNLLSDQSAWPALAELPIHVSNVLEKII